MVLKGYYQIYLVIQSTVQKLHRWSRPGKLRPWTTDWDLHIFATWNAWEISNMILQSSPTATCTNVLYYPNILNCSTYKYTNWKTSKILVYKFTGINHRLMCKPIKTLHCADDLYPAYYCESAFLKFWFIKFSSAQQCSQG